MHLIRLLAAHSWTFAKTGTTWHRACHHFPNSWTSPFNQSEAIENRKQKNINPAVILAERVESAQSLAILNPVLSGLVAKGLIGVRRDGHAASEYWFKKHSR